MSSQTCPHPASVHRRGDPAGGCASTMRLLTTGQSLGTAVCTCVCMCVYMCSCVHACVCMYPCVPACACVSVCACVCVHACTCACACMQVCTCLAQTCIHVCMRVHVCVHVVWPSSSHPSNSHWRSPEAHLGTNPSPQPSPFSGKSHRFGWICHSVPCPSRRSILHVAKESISHPEMSSPGHSSSHPQPCSSPNAQTQSHSRFSLRIEMLCKIG